jgi:hypothetical protein
MLRRILPGALGQLALFLFAIDGAHVLVVGWLANRNALVAAVPALLGLWMHLEWREHHRAWALPVSLAGLAVGLLGGESALGVFAYVAAYELLGAPGPLKQRARALAPAALLGLLYVGIYKLRGYGSAGSGSYMDPMGETGRFVVGALGRIPAMLCGLVLEIPSDLWALDERTRPSLVTLGVLGLGLLVWLLRAAWPGLTGEERRHCRWLFLGAALSLVPVAATFPSNRLLLLPGLGGTVAVAVVLVHAWRTRARAGRRWGVMTGAGVLAFGHLLLAPLLWPLMFASLWAVQQQTATIVQTLEAELDYKAVPGQRVVTLAMPVPTFAMYLPFVMAANGMPKPQAWWSLTLSPQPHVFTRTAAETFELSLSQGRLLSSEFETVFRGPNHPLRAGQQVKLKGMTVTVLEADEKGASRLGFTFDTPLEELVLLGWKDGAVHRFTPPPVGAHVPL